MIKSCGTYCNKLTKLPTSLSPIHTNPTIHRASQGNEQEDIFKNQGDREEILSYLKSANER